MKLYYTLIQKFCHDDDRSLYEFFLNNKIKFKLSADFARDLTHNGSYSVYSPTQFVKTYTVLIEEHELSAIMLSVGGVVVVDNSNSINRKNNIRKFLRMFWRE